MEENVYNSSTNKIKNMHLLLNKYIRNWGKENKTLNNHK